MVLTVSYRQVIAGLPDGGGAYAVSKAHLGRIPALVASASLVVDYGLNVVVSVSAGVAALTSTFPAPLPYAAVRSSSSPPRSSREHLWQRLLQNQRGAVLDRALRRRSRAVVCRLRFRV